MKVDPNIAANPAYEEVKCDQEDHTYDVVSEGVAEEGWMTTLHVYIFTYTIPWLLHGKYNFNGQHQNRIPLLCTVRPCQRPEFVESAMETLDKALPSGYQFHWWQIETSNAVVSSWSCYPGHSWHASRDSTNKTGWVFFTEEDYEIFQFRQQRAPGETVNSSQQDYEISWPSRTGRHHVLHKLLIYVTPTTGYTRSRSSDNHRHVLVSQDCGIAFHWSTWTSRAVQSKPHWRISWQHFLSNFNSAPSMLHV